MGRPGPFVAETELQAPRRGWQGPGGARSTSRRGHVNPGSDFQDPPRADAELVRAADRVLEAAQRFIDGNLPYGAFFLLVSRYRAAAARALAAGVIRPPESKVMAEQDMSVSAPQGKADG